MSDADAGDSWVDAAIHERITLLAYDADWPHRFAAERERLRGRFPRMLRIEHVGSTAVAGMPAKPIIDILAGVTSLPDADQMFEPILAYGYTTSRAFNATLADRRWFMRSAHGKRTHHLHLVVADGPVWTQWIRFRDALRADAALAQRYAALKARLAVEYVDDREGYTQGKSEFVASVIGGERES